MRPGITFSTKLYLPYLAKKSRNAHAIGAAKDKSINSGLIELVTRHGMHKIMRAQDMLKIHFAGALA